jgi:hypothetical protein
VNNRSFIDKKLLDIPRIIGQPSLSQPLRIRGQNNLLAGTLLKIATSVYDP